MSLWVCLHSPLSKKRWIIFYPAENLCSSRNLTSFEKINQTTVYCFCICCTNLLEACRSSTESINAIPAIPFFKMQLNFSFATSVTLSVTILNKGDFLIRFNKLPFTWLPSIIVSSSRTLLYRLWKYATSSTPMYSTSSSNKFGLLSRKTLRFLSNPVNLFTVNGGFYVFALSHN